MTKTRVKLRKGAWYVRVRGSFLPRTWQGLMLHLLLVLFIIGIFVIAHNDSRSVVVVAMTTVLELLGIGAVFTWIARFKS